MSDTPNELTYEVLKVSLVLVGVEFLVDPNDLEEFSDAVVSDLMSTYTMFALNNEQPGVTVRYEIPSERFTIEVSHELTVITFQFPEKDKMERFAEVISLSTEMSRLSKDSPVPAYGFNIECVYKQSSGENSLHYLGHRMFSNPVTASSEWSLIGGTANLTYESPDGIWNIKAEPRLDKIDEVFLRTNLHQEQKPIPNQEEIVKSINKVWDISQAVSLAINSR